MTIDDKRAGKRIVPVLSLILCSRNDEYMGNSRWRLETSLNYVADQVEALSRAEDVEVLVADWGSEIPLRDVLRLTPAAAAIVSFILIPPETARPLQKDSPFPEVLALNAAARRARGTYIGRIDQDTLVGKRFLEVFFELYDGKRQLSIPLDRALLYSNRREIPYWFAVRCPDRPHVAKFIRLLGPRCAVDRIRGREFWTYWVGIWLIHSNLWTECGGYDERYIYYNWMEVEMILRLRQRYELIDFGKIVDYDFYHLGHRNPRGALTWRDFKENAFIGMNAPPPPYYPNAGTWGLADLTLEPASAAPGLEASPLQDSRSDALAFASLVARTGMQLMLDKAHLLLVRGPHFFLVKRPLVFLVKKRLLWAHRAQKVRAALRGQHLLKWPWIVMELWAMRGRGAQYESPRDSVRTMGREADGPPAQSGSPPHPPH
jgi:hypothetical protein